ncbi:hypothetical protein TNCV_2655781 [Trichonephila clavipes]|nr:hypothetical protein TNCV_2655781 [Trichonephila clavipes]
MYEGFGDGPRNFEPWSFNVDDTRNGTPSPKPHPHQRRTFQLSTDLVHRCPTRRVFSGTARTRDKKPATIRCLYHTATAPTQATKEVWQRPSDSISSARNSSIKGRQIATSGSDKLYLQLFPTLLTVTQKPHAEMFTVAPLSTKIHDELPAPLFKRLLQVPQSLFTSSLGALLAPLPYQCPLATAALHNRHTLHSKEKTSS